MFVRILVPIFINFIELVFSSIDYSYFKSTKVIIESCSRTSALAVFTSQNIFSCALKCSENVNCRRFMICNQQNGIECSLFLEGENCATPLPADCSCFMKTFSLVKNKTICPLGLYGYNCESTIIDCSEGNDRGLDVFTEWVRSYIKPVGLTSAFEVTCGFQYGGYTLFMSRDSLCQDVSFNRNITEYIKGFGDVDGDHWLGLKRIKGILNNHPRNRLSVILYGIDYCENLYDNFSIGTAIEGYPIHLGVYETWPSLKCGDSFKSAVNIEGSQFSAPESDQTSFNCADNRHGGWWYADDSRCSDSNLMGSRDAMVWSTSLGSTPLNLVGLRIKPSHK